jgi:predicted dehydrogenase
VGYGYWGPNLVRNLANLETCTLRAICDLSDAARARAAEKYPDVPVTADLDALLADKTIHAVVVATPAATHKLLVERALRAGKHVLVEKPIATTVADAKALVDLAAKLKLTLAVGHTFLYTGAVRAARAAVQSGAIGRVLCATSRRENLGLHRPDANVIWDLAPHDVSILQFVSGRRVVRAGTHTVSAIIRDLPDVASFALEMDDRSTSFVVVSWLGHRKVREMAWIGTTGCLVYDDNEPVEKLRRSDRRADLSHAADGTPKVTYTEGAPVALPIENLEALRALCANFVDAVAGRAAPDTDGRAGLDVVAVLEALERSRANGGRMEEVTHV